MKTKITKVLLVLVGSVGLLMAGLTGCSTTSNQGGMSSDTEYGGGSGSGPAQVATGPDGSVSRTNPLGLGTGSGLSPLPAH